MFTNLFSLPQSLKQLVELNLPTRKDVFLLSTILFLNSRNGYLKMNAFMSAWNPLVSTGFRSSIFLKMKGNKDDTKDSKWIGDLFRLGLVMGSYIPCKKIRILREFTRYRYKLVSCRSSEKNRYQNALTVCNVALDSVVSDVFGKSSTSIIDYLLEQSGTSIDHEVIASKLLKRLNTLVPGTLTIFRIILISQISKKIHPSGPFSLISNFFIPILTKFLLAFL